jgi:hypothetical protein
VGATPRRRRRTCDGNLWIYAVTLLYGGQRVPRFIVTTYGRGGGVGRGLGGGLDLGVGVGLGVGVAVGVTVAVGVAVALAVAVGVALVAAVAVAVGVDVGVGVPAGPVVQELSVPGLLQKNSVKQVSSLCTPAVALLAPPLTAP